MQNDEGVELVVVGFYVLRYLDLVFKGKIAGVQEIVELFDLVEYSLFKRSDGGDALITLKALSF